MAKAVNEMVLTTTTNYGFGHLNDDLIAALFSNGGHIYWQ